MGKMTIKIVPDDIKMCFGIENCSLIIINRRKEFLCEDIVVKEGVIVIEVMQKVKKSRNSKEG